MGTIKTTHKIRERVWLLNLGRDVKRYIEDCYAFTVAIPRNNSPPIHNWPLPSGPWQEVALDFKGPNGGNNHPLRDKCLTCFINYKMMNN